MCADLVALTGRLRRALGDRAVRTGPDLVVFPRDADQVQAVARECLAAGVRFGGGRVPPGDGSVLVVTSRMRRIIEIDLPNQRAVVEPGVTSVADRVPGFAPGRVTGLQACVGDGDLSWLGPGKAAETPGYDLVAAAGTLCVTTKLVVELVRVPETVVTVLAAFRAPDEAAAAVGAIVGAGLDPAAMEIMDAVAVATAEQGGVSGYPAGAGAVLIVECAGPDVEASAQVADVELLCRGAGAFAVRRATADQDRAEIWRGRDAVFATGRRVSPGYLAEDCAVAPARLAGVLREIAELAAAAGVRAATVYRVGDGVLRVLVLYQQRRRGAAGVAAEVARAVVDRCGPPAPGADDLHTMNLVRHAFEAEPR
jgi:glycolate oxidase